MKKLILILQILVFTSQSVFADDTRLVTQSVVHDIAPSIVSQMPRDYKLPDMQLLDTVAFYNQYKDQIGKRVTVEGITGRFGATFGEEFKKKIFDIESQSKETIEIILSLTSTMEDAKILKQRMALVGRKMVIVEIPDDVQNEILERAAAQATGGLKELWWDTKHKTNKLLHPIKTASDSLKIFKNQFVTPNIYDFNIVKVSVATTLATTAVLLFVPGVDPGLALSMALSRILIGGTALTFRRTIGNLYKADFSREVSPRSSLAQVALRLPTMGLGLGQAYYAIGSSFDSESYGLTQKQVISTTFTSGAIDTAASIQRDRRLSQVANYRMSVYSLIVGSAISTIGIIGFVGPVVLEYGLVQINTHQIFSLVIYSGLLLSYKYFSDRVEKIARKDLKMHFTERYRKFISFRELKKEREIKERLEIIEKRKNLEEIINDLKIAKVQNRASLNPACSRLFY